MPGVATFTFYGALLDFLKPSEREQPIAYTFTGTPALKDAIEAIGIPHPEVAVILQHDTPAFFNSRLHTGQQIHVFPYQSKLPLPKGYALAPKVPEPYKFVLDVHLGTLARALRMLGFDALYEQNQTDAHIAQVACSENRIVLTRDVGLLKQKIIDHGYWLRSQDTKEQVKEIISRFNLTSHFDPFRRCLLCNALVKPVAKKQILDKLPPKTRLYFNEFYQCTACGKVYWKGSHYEHMQAVISKLTS